MPNHAKEVQAMLKAAGWFPGRDVSGQLQLPDGYTIHQQALAVLSEFAGLNIGKVGRGIDHARSTISIDAMVGVGLQDMFHDFSESISYSLYPIGVISEGLIYLAAIDERSYVFLLEGDDYMFMGRSFAEALDRMLLGKAPLPFDPPTDA